MTIHAICHVIDRILEACILGLDERLLLCGRCIVYLLRVEVVACVYVCLYVCVSECVFG